MERSKQFYEFLSNVYDNILNSATACRKEGTIRDIEVNRDFLNHDEVKVTYHITYLQPGNGFRQLHRERVYPLSDQFEDSLGILPEMVEDIKGGDFKAG